MCASLTSFFFYCSLFCFSFSHCWETFFFLFYCYVQSLTPSPLISNFFSRFFFFLLFDKLFHSPQRDIFLYPLTVFFSLFFSFVEVAVCLPHICFFFYPGGLRRADAAIYLLFTLLQQHHFSFPEVMVTICFVFFLTISLLLSVVFSLLLINLKAFACVLSVPPAFLRQPPHH